MEVLKLLIDDWKQLLKECKMKFKCTCGHIETDECLDVFHGENSLCTTAFCKKCGKKYTKEYILGSFEEWV